MTKRETNTGSDMANPYTNLK